MTSFATVKEVAGALADPPAASSGFIEKHPLPLEADVSSLDYDCDSFSDGLEKADTTPENLKKIDDVIETTAAIVATSVPSRSAHVWSRPTVATTCTTTTTPEPVLHDADADESVLKLDLNEEKSTKLHFSANKDIYRKQQHQYDDRFVSATGISTPSSTANMDESSIDSTSATGLAKQCFAFTIDNFNEKESDPAVAQAKYRNMLERFQHRHRRGSSLSKLEEVSNAKEIISTSISVPPLTLTKSVAKSSNAEECEVFEKATDAETTASSIASKVKLRPRDRSTSRVRDSSKRHSWSPRSSTSEVPTQSPAQTAQPKASSTANQQHQQSASRNRQNSSIPPQGTRKANVTKINLNTSTITKGKKTSAATFPSGAIARHFTPRSTAMQLAFQKVDFLGAQPPLADFNYLNGSEADNISETGTYTLDGDNYTEEQKDLMNIDKNKCLDRAHKARRTGQTALNRPKDLEWGSTKDTANTISSCRRQNVLEVNYYHEPESATRRRSDSGKDFTLKGYQSASSYLEKIKSHVLHKLSMTKAALQDDCVSHKSRFDSGSEPKTSPSDEDKGFFTSVTASGVLAKQNALDAHPKVTRHTDLSTSQIDSSEYVSNEVKLKQSVAAVAAAYSAGGFTDRQKAEYRLNVFTNQKESHSAFAAAGRTLLQTPPDSPKSEKSKLSDAALLKRAQNKNDWIQEWARNARARSLASCDSGTKQRRPSKTQDLMTRSYTCSSETGGGGDSLTDDGITQQLPAMNYQKSLAAHHKLAGGGGEFDYSSDPAISTAISSSDSSRPPKSPTKIPSPINSLGRTRASRTRASLQNMPQLDAAEADCYLQRTAAAINNLQQNLSRKNSLKSPPTGSPRETYSTKKSAGFYSPDEDCSPHHSLESPPDGGEGGGVINYQQPLLRTAHKRNLSVEAYHRDEHAQQLMTSSYNEQQLKLLTSGNQQRLRGRKNSFDDNMQHLVMPNSPLAARRSNHKYGTQTTRESGRVRIVEQHQQQEQASVSPLRRSSSYSAKIATARTARPQFQNTYTPPAARHNYMPPASSNNHQQPPMLASVAQRIQKSASSNNFSNVYSDYEENLAYHIKDEDDEYVDDDDDGLEDFYSSGEEELAVHGGYHRYGQTEDTFAAAAADRNEGDNVPPFNTRCNKALLMRIERSRQKVAGMIAPPSGSMRAPIGTGVLACPNTPELPRRNVRSAPRSNAARQSMPRDTSLNRLSARIPNSLASAKKQLLQTAAAPIRPSTTSSKGTSGRVQPKYLDISKYKPVQGNNFLRKNDAKSTLKSGGGETVRRSPSSSSMGLSRSDGTRASNRSSKSASSAMSTSGSGLTVRGSSAVRRDTSAAKQKEAEMAMWKRRSKYDPMKAAAEDRRKKEEAKKMALAKHEFVSESAYQSNSYLRQTSCDDQRWTADLEEII